VWMWVRPGCVRRLQFDTCTEYLWRQTGSGGGQGVMRPDLRASGRAWSALDSSRQFPSLGWSPMSSEATFEMSETQS